jgi:hypothetical protein
MKQTVPESTNSKVSKEKGVVTIFAKRLKQPRSPDHGPLEISQVRLAEILIVQKEIVETNLELETLLTSLRTDLIRGAQIEPGLHTAYLKKIFQVGSDMVPELITKLIVR